MQTDGGLIWMGLEWLSGIERRININASKGEKLLNFKLFVFLHLVYRKGHGAAHKIYIVFTAL